MTYYFCGPEAYAYKKIFLVRGMPWRIGCCTCACDVYQI